MRKVLFNFFVMFGRGGGGVNLCKFCMPDYKLCFFFWFGKVA